MEFRDYLTFLQELCRELDTLRGVEQQKIAAIQAGNLEALDACMKQEQAAALSLRGREQHRKAMLRDLGLEHVSLAELSRHCPPQDRERTAALSQQVLRSYQVLSSAQQTARTLMESRLHRIEQELEQVFVLTDPVKGIYRCKYCEEQYRRHKKITK